MALSTYSDLTTAVANWLMRPGDTEITSDVDDLVTLCEQRIHYGAAEGSPFPTEALRIRAMETSRALPIGAPTSCGTATGTANAIVLTPATAVTSLTRGTLLSFVSAFDNTSATTIAVSGLTATAVVTGSASSALSGGEITKAATHQVYYDGTNFVLLPDSCGLPLPPSYLGMRSFYIPGSPRIDLEYITPDQFNSFAVEDGSTGRPLRYTIEADAFRFDPQPDTAYTPFLLYYKKFPALSTATTNWLFTNAPSVYLYGSLLEAALFIADDAQAQKWGSAYRSACSGLVSSDTLDRHAGGSLIMRNPSGNP